MENEFGSLLNLCAGCSSAVDQFCKLFHELKCLKLQLELKLGGIIKRIKLGGTLPSSTFHFEKLLEETLKNDELKLCEGQILLKTFRESKIQTGTR